MERVGSDFARDNPSVRVVGLRYFNVYGPGESFKGAAASMVWQLSGQMLSGKRPRIFKWGEQFRDFIYVRDIVEANLRAAGASAGGVFNACTGKTTTFNRIIEALNGVLGTSLTTEYFENPYGFYQDETLGDPAAAASALGFTARFDMAAGIKDYLGGVRAADQDKDKDRTQRLAQSQVR